MKVYEQRVKFVTENICEMFSTVHYAFVKGEVSNKETEEIKFVLDDYALEPWSSKRLGILTKYTTSEKLSIATVSMVTVNINCTRLSGDPSLKYKTVLMRCNLIPPRVLVLRTIIYVSFLNIYKCVYTLKCFN